MEEIWKDIEGYEGYYAVSNLGRVKRHDTYAPATDGTYYRRRGRILKNIKMTIGYTSVTLRRNVSTRYYVHRLVAAAFISNPDNLPIVNHKDGNKANNHVSNLEWCDQGHNIREDFRTGRRKLGDYHHNATITPGKARLIKARLSEGMSARNVANLLNVGVSTVWIIMNGKHRWAKV